MYINIMYVVYNITNDDYVLLFAVQEYMSQVNITDKT